jgi:hypothetical protein
MRVPQLELGPRFGGMKELATRVTFYNGIANTLMVAGVYYQSNPIVPGTALRLQEAVPTVAAFYGSLVLFGLVAMGFEHVVMVKAQAEYNQLQQFDENVSPIRRDVSELAESVEELREAVNELDEG